MNAGKKRTNKKQNRKVLVLTLIDASIVFVVDLHSASFANVLYFLSALI